MNSQRGIVFIFIVILTIITGYRYFSNESKKSNNEQVEIKIEKLEFNKFEKPDIENRYNLNYMSYEDMVKNGITERRARGIVDYREIKGVIKSIDELSLVKGIGPKTVEKMKKRYNVGDIKLDKKTNKRVNINSGEKQNLIFAGFTEYEIEKLNRWKKENGEIFSNIDLVKIIGEDRYNKLRDNIKYSEF